ncbi:hypothetical protein Sango_1042500 [Sesamum angolense]|uniref:Uncharacterized protein n=1 Tax=Sesamum angolense TaxID=2727404 RepID=A0AAE1X146_9LAMI|nr:hypothetical protein Sango_1042500 [Sesamum angolense]
MCHPSDAEAWKHFDWMYPDFAKESRNIRLGLCTDGFTLHCQYGHTYSCWPVIIMSYNLFPVDRRDVRPYDHATDSAFIMQATLMWTVNNLPAYRMASRWSTAGVMGCPICMDDIRAFHLQHGDQILDRVANISPAIEMPLSLPDGYDSDHKWTKKNLFWNLPCWSTLLIRQP